MQPIFSSGEYFQSAKQNLNRLHIHVLKSENKYFNLDAINCSRQKNVNICIMLQLSLKAHLPIIKKQATSVLMLIKNLFLTK